MSAFEDVEVPFVVVGDKQALTDRQLAENAWLRNFVAAFPQCFQRDDAACAYYFYKDGVP